MKKRKKKINRSERKYPALDTKTNLKIRADLIDFDYLSKLSENDKEWLNRFSEEYINADFRHEKPLHKTKKLRRDCYNRNNRRNHCVYGKAKARGDVYDYVTPDVTEEVYDGEEALNAVVDNGNQVELLIESLITKYSLPNKEDVKNSIYELFVKYNFNLDRVDSFIQKNLKR